jgi:hypothetical protein
VFAAFAESLVDAVESMLGAPGDLQDVVGLALLAILERHTDAGWSLVVPGRLHQESASDQPATHRDRCALRTRTSARSDVFQQFDGGPGQIALHGLTNVGGVLGTAASHGCVRLDNGVMRWLVKRIRPGTTVII